MAKSGKKAKKGKMPKEVFGVKLPKEMRRAGERLIERAQSAEGQRVIASGLAMAATAAAAMAAQKARTAMPAEKPAAPGDQGTGGASFDPGQVADAVGQVADALIGRFLGARTPR